MPTNAGCDSSVLTEAKTLRILNIAYPFSPVNDSSVGGAEQILYQIDCALTEAGVTSIVIGCTGSEISGKLIATETFSGPIIHSVKIAAYGLYRQAIHQAIEEHHPDVIHFHGVDCTAYLPSTSIPLLITLHCPCSFYDCALFTLNWRNLFMHCVSSSQHATAPKNAGLLPPIQNGVPIPQHSPPYPKEEYALTVGRICPEKNVHVAVEAAKRADCSLLIAGAIFPYETHQAYFKEVVLPKLDHRRRFIGPVGGQLKWKLYSQARCTLIPSLAQETSSLVAMESMACGTPVIAFPSGALPEIIEHGQTGFLVHDVAGMATAIQSAIEIQPSTCRRIAAERFSLKEMTNQYLSLYRRLARNGTGCGMLQKGQTLCPSVHKESE